METQAAGQPGRDDLAAGRERWQRRFQESRVRAADFSTLSGLEVDPVYGPPPGSVVPGFERIGWPGEYPFTRGLYPAGYRGRAWTIRQFSGFGNARQTNQRYRMLLGTGGTGLSVAFDMPTLMGHDSDDPRSLGEVGHCGVAIDSAADMDLLFDGIPLADVTTSMTISGPAVPVFCMYLAAAERQGADLAVLDGTLQTDIFKEYIAQKEWLFPPQPHLRLIGDLMEYCAAEIPAYKPLSVSGYHIREAGSTAAQELAFTLADGFGYVELGLSRGLDIETFVPGLSFFFDAHIDFFEEIAKFRAARRIWARWLRDRYGATSARAQWLRFHTQTAGVSLTAQQPDNNVVRTAIEALAAVLGGTNSLHTNALDEVLALPSERAAEIAVRTQQVIMEETGVASVADPLGGSWYLEALTDRLEAAAEEVFAQILAMSPDQTMTGGILHGIEDRLVLRRDRRSRVRLSAEGGEGRQEGRWGQRAHRHGRLPGGDPPGQPPGGAGAGGRAGPPPGGPGSGGGGCGAGPDAGRGPDRGEHDPADAGRGPGRGHAGRDLRRTAGRVGQLLRSARVLSGGPESTRPGCGGARGTRGAPRRCPGQPDRRDRPASGAPAGGGRPSPPGGNRCPARAPWHRRASPGPTAR